MLFQDNDIPIQEDLKVPEKKSQNFLHGAAVLAATVAIIKALGAVYKIALGNIIGDEGFAHFTVAYNIYNLLLTLSTAGLPIAVSKMVSEANALGRRREIKRIFNISAAAFCLLGLLGSAVMFTFSRELAAGFGDIEAEMSILALCPSVFFVCLMSSYRGYTQGYADMKLTSVSQIAEVLGKVIFGLALAGFLLKYGLPAASAGAIAGVSAGSVLALMYSAIYVRRMNKELSKQAAHDKPESSKRLFLKLASIAIPIAFGTSVLNLINLIDTKLIMSLLQESAGYSYAEAKVLFGVFGKVQTLFNIPSSFIFPLAISVIPAISSYAARRKEREAAEAARIAIKITTLLGLPAGVGLSVMSEPIMTVLFHGSAPEGIGLLAILGISSYFSCMVLITNAILQAFGREKLPIITVAIGGALKLIIDYAMVGNPQFGIYGAAIGTFFCYAVISLLNLLVLKKLRPSGSGYFKQLIKPLFCSALMGAAAYFSFPLFYSLLDSIAYNTKVWTLSAAAMTASIGLAIIVYFAAISATKALSREELKLLPGGKNLAKILRIR